MRVRPALGVPRLIGHQLLARAAGAACKLRVAKSGPGPVHVVVGAHTVLFTAHHHGAETVRARLELPLPGRPRPRPSRRQHYQHCRQHTARKRMVLLLQGLNNDKKRLHTLLIQHIIACLVIKFSVPRASSVPRPAQPRPGLLTRTLLLYPAVLCLLLSGGTRREDEPRDEEYDKGE